MRAHNNFHKAEPRNEMKFFFQSWSVFHNIWFAVVSKETGDSMISSELVWGWMVSNPIHMHAAFVFSVCCVCRVCREKGVTASGCRGDSLEILLIRGWPWGQGDTWYYQDHWLETSTRTRTDGHAWANLSVWIVTHMNHKNRVRPSQWPENTTGHEEGQVK